MGKFIDFQVTSGETLVEPCYTPLYAAPEVRRLPILVLHLTWSVYKWKMVKITLLAIYKLEIFY